jgi:hypothetical protein
MSTITIDRAVLEQALKTIESWNPSLRTDDDAAAITSLRAALEQEEPPPTRSPKENDRVICIEDESLGTVLWTDDAEGPYIKFDDGRYGQWMLHEFGKLFRYAELAQQAEVPLVVGCGGNNTAGSWLQEQEQVARVLQTVGQYHTGRFVAEVETVRRLRGGESLYTHPPRREWVSLTEEEIATITKESARGSAIRRDGTTSHRIARAIEAALKEKNT